MTIQKVALIGAAGNLGPHVLNALQASPLDLTVLSRKSSKSKYADDIKTATIPDDSDEAELAKSFAGFDAVVVTIPGKTYHEQVAIANACVKAGVKRLIPADFGSVDSELQIAQDLLPLYNLRAKTRKHLIHLANENPGFSWTSLVAAHFFDWGLKEGLLGFDLKKSTAVIFDDGERKWSGTTLPKIGEAVVKVLQKEEETRNKMLYIQSFNVSQYDLLDVLINASGRTFEVDHVKSEQYIEERKAKVDAGDAEAIEQTVGVLGLILSDWEARGILANDLLELSKENLDEVVKKVYTSM